jgi:hypothetical protein
MNRRLCLGVLLALGAGPALAADWHFDPKIAVSGVYNDNNRLTSVAEDEIEVVGARVDAQLMLRAETPRSSFRLTPRLRSTFFPGDEPEETDDQFLRLATWHRFERARISLNVNYSRIETRGSYFPQTTPRDDDELGEPDRGVGVGQAGSRNREDRLAVAPAFQFELNPRQSLELAAELLDTSYDFQVEGDRQDYRDVYGAVAFRHAFSESTTLRLRATHSTYDPELGERLDAQGLDAEWRKRISETSQFYLRGGATRVEVETTPGAIDWETGFTGGAGVRWAYEVTDIWLDASRNLDPNAAGIVATRDQLRLQWARKLSQVTRVTLGGRVIRDSRPGSETSSGDRTYGTGTAGFDWRFAQAWTLFGAYEYKFRDATGDARSAGSNDVSLGIVYEPNRR